MQNGTWLTIAVYVVWVLIIIVAGVYIAWNRKPSSAIAWIMAIVFIPLIGIVFFLLIGNWRLNRHRRDKQAHVSEIFLERTEGLHLASHPDEWPDWLPTIVDAQPQSRRAADGRQQHRRAAARLPRLDPGHGRRESTRRENYVYIEFFILVDDETTKPIIDAIGRACTARREGQGLSDHIAQFSYPNRKGTVERLRSSRRRVPADAAASSRSRSTSGGPTCATTASSW